VKVLVADDDRTSLLVVETAIRSLGHEVHVATDGAQAWGAFQQLEPDVVISDWKMPLLTGLQLCQKIRGYGPGYTYFIMVTGQGGHDQILEGMAAGADDYLIKPLDAEDLEVRLIAAARVTALHHQLARQRRELEAFNAKLNANLTEIAHLDPLTGLRNRRALQEDLELLEVRVSRYGHRYCMALLDVDHFKAYNDTYGHPAGDRILQTVAAELVRQARSGDIVYRYGGEEFLCIFPEQSLATGTIAVERMRAGLEELAIPHGATPRGRLTVSAGMAVLDPHQVRFASEVLEEADEALYRAKDLGRNRVEHVLRQAA
jgi:two-component system chemotaxis response regulator CheY